MAPTDHGVDATVQTFRRLLARTATDESARVEALAALSKRTVFVAAGPDGRLRALANRHGRTALPVFTGRDTLGQAALRFGWFRPDGGLDGREIGAREGLRAALERGVEYMVIDIGTGQQMEITRLEINAALAARRPTGSFDPRRDSERPSEIIREAVRQSERPQDVEPFELAAPEPAVKPAPAGAPLQRARPPARAASNPIDIDVPFARRARERAPTEPMPVAAAPKPRRAEPRAPTEPAVVPPARTHRAPLAAFPEAEPRAQARAEAPTAGFPEAEPPVASFPEAEPLGRVAQSAPQLDPLPGLPSALPPVAERGDGERHEPAYVGSEHMPDLPSIDLSAETPRGTASRVLTQEPEAQPGALQAAALVRDIARKSGDADIEEVAAEVAAMLQDTALRGGVTDKKGPGLVAAEVARMLGGEVRQGGEALEASDGFAIEGEALLGDEAIAAIAEVLRNYPEVEWACDLSNARGEPAIGVRVDPSFLTRIDQITKKSVAAVAPIELVVHVLSDPAKMRKARSEGTMFFPFKGKR